MTREQKIELCRLYNMSDIECLVYMRQFCNKEQLVLLERLIYLNEETEIGWGEKSCTGEELDEYHDGKWKLLNAFGIENDEGDACFEGECY